MYLWQLSIKHLSWPVLFDLKSETLRDKSIVCEKIVLWETVSNLTVSVVQYVEPNLDFEESAQIGR